MRGTGHARRIRARRRALSSSCLDRRVGTSGGLRAGRAGRRPGGPGRRSDVRHVRPAATAPVAVGGCGDRPVHAGRAPHLPCVDADRERNGIGGTRVGGTPWLGPDGFTGSVPAVGGAAPVPADCPAAGSPGTGRWAPEAVGRGGRVRTGAGGSVRCSSPISPRLSPGPAAGRRWPRWPVPSVPSVRPLRGRSGPFWSPRRSRSRATRRIREMCIWEQPTRSAICDWVRLPANRRVITWSSRSGSSASNGRSVSRSSTRV